MKIKFFAPRRDLLPPNFMVYTSRFEKIDIATNARRLDLPEDEYVFLLIKFALDHQYSIFYLLKEKRFETGD